MTTRRLGPLPRVPGTGLAVAAAFAMIAYQVGAKTTRDALFLSSFPVSALPAMTIASAVFSVAMAFLAARLLSIHGPERVIPLGFAGSAALLVGEWAMVGPWPRGAAVVVYLHYGGLGALLISGFYAFLNERFDPRTAKRAIGRVLFGGTIGGLAGGAMAERIGSAASVGMILPALAILHLTCALLVRRLRDVAPALAVDPERKMDTREVVETPRSAEMPPARQSGLRVLAGSSFLRTLATLVVLVAVAEGLIDWVFKARAAGSMASQQELVRLFALFYAGVSLATAIVQALLSRMQALERLGLARSVATLPAFVAAGSVGALLWPGLSSTLLLLGGETVLANSVYRGGYEAFFTPVAPRDKRAVKTIVDVGGTRAGDFFGAGLVQAVLLAAGMGPAPLTILLLAVAVSGAAIVVALRLHAGYLATLERALSRHAEWIDPSDVHDATTRSIVLRRLTDAVSSGIFTRSTIDAPTRDRPASPAEGAAAEPARSAVEARAARAAALASGRRDEVRRALTQGPLPPALVPQAIALLAWDDVAREAIAALRRIGPEAVEPMAAALTDRDSDFTVRRRLPLVLGTIADAPAVEALLRGLSDRRFEVRYRCGLALSHLLLEHSRLGVPPDRVYEAVLREVRLERPVWDSQRVLDQWDDAAWSPMADDALRARANRSLEHVFTLLSLALPRQPLRIAFRGLQTADPLLRGTALEYLETSLPPEIRRELWTYLEDDRPRRRDMRSPDQALADLLRSNESIVIRLDELRGGERDAP